MRAALYPGRAGGGGAVAAGSTAKLAPGEEAVLRTQAGKTGSTGVLCKPARKGNCCGSWTQKQGISSYFPALIAVAPNKLLFSPSTGSRVEGHAMSSTPITLSAGSIPRRADNVEIAPQIS